MATVILVVADKTSLSASGGEDAIKSRIEGLGHTVILRSDEDAEESEGIYDAVVVSEFASSTTVGTKYKTSTKGVILLENGSWDDFDMQTGSTTSTGRSTWWIESGAGALAAGLSGDTTIYSASQTVHYEEDTNLGAGVIIVARHSSGGTRVSEYAYDAGAAMAIGNAPGRRIALSILDASISLADANLWALFDAAVTWVIGDIGVQVPLIVKTAI